MIEPTQRDIVKGALFDFIVAAGAESSLDVMNEGFTAFAELLAEQLALTIPDTTALKLPTKATP